MKKMLSVLIIACLLTGCSHLSNKMTNTSVMPRGESYSVNNDVMSQPMMASSDYLAGISNDSYTYTPTSQIADDNRKFIRNVDISLVVSESDLLQETVDYVVNLADKYDGYVTYSSANFNDGYDYGSITLRIPKDTVDNMLLEIQQQSFDVKGITDSYDDVTTQYVDTESRLKMKEIARDKYMEMLEQAESMEDILNIQRELNIILEDLEAAKSQMNRLDNKIEFTEVRVSIECRHNIMKVGFIDRVASGIVDIVENIADPLIAGLSILIGGLILIVCISPVIYLGIRLIMFSIHTKIKFKRSKKKEIT